MAKKVNLRKEIRQLRRDLRKSDLDSVREQFRASRREVRVARQELQVELQKLNNLRTEVTTDRGQFILKDAYEADQLRMFDQIRTLRSGADRAGGLNAAWGYVLAVAVVIGEALLRATGH